VRVKLAASLDGRTALLNGDSQWITGEESRQDVQKWRARSSAILTGIGTVLADDPSMTARVDDPPKYPLRVIADTHWRTPPKSRILRNPSTAIVAGGMHSSIPEELSGCGAQCLPLPLDQDRIDLAALMKALADKDVNELQVEAGAGLCGSLLAAGLVDEVLLYLAPVLLGDGGPGLFSFGPLESMQERTHLEVLESSRIGDDLRLRLKPDNVAMMDRLAS
jgi:diaminohydroxyphosphoribosylaminopyrimidine deaminase/5-amino-6-(5-phosphoribosylamino)uracil reductase